MEKTRRQYRIEVDLLERFDRVNKVLMANGSEVVRRLIEEYTIQKEEMLKVKVEEIFEMKENFPIDNESYVVGKAENGKFFFAWGSEYPYADDVPSYDISDGESGIEWYESKEEALTAMNESVEAVENK